MPNPTHPLKSGYVWMLIAIPLTSVVMGGFLLWFSISSFDGMVVDDYYQKGLQINLELARDQRALKAGVQGQLSIESSATRVTVQHSEPQFQFPADLKITFSHATRAGLDQIVNLHQDAPGQYLGASVALVPGRWYIQLGNTDWRISSSILVADVPRPYRAQLTATRSGL